MRKVFIQDAVSSEMRLRQFQMDNTRYKKMKRLVKSIVFPPPFQVCICECQLLGDVAHHNCQANNF
jgi:hypothetical protein